MTYPNPEQNPYGQQPPQGQPQYGQPQYGQPQYGQPQYGANPGVPPENNLVWGILATVFCCLPLGIVAIVKANQVSSLWAAGDFAGAQQAADDAKKYSLWSLIAAVIMWVVIVIFYFIFFAAILASSSSTY